MASPPITQPWHRLSIEQATQQLAVDPAAGLDAQEVQKRLAQYGPNKLAEKAREPGWKAFLRQYKDLMQIILVVVALISLWPLKDFQTFLLLIVLTEFNAAAASLEGGFHLPTEHIGVSAETIANRVWKLIQHPRRVIYVPAWLGITPYVENTFGWLIDRLGPLLLRFQARRK